MTLTAWAIGLAITWPLAAAAQAAPLSLQEQARQLMTWWEGDFDNFRQVAAQSGGECADVADKPFFRVHGVYREVDAPRLGERVL